MPHTEAIDSAEADNRPVVELRVSADASQLSVVRAVAATIAGQSDFDTDSIADMRLAIDEACSHLIMRAEPAAIMLCRFRSSGDALVVSVSAPTTDSAPSSLRTFGWHVLNALTDEISMKHDAVAERPGSYSTTIEFTKRKGGSIE